MVGVESVTAGVGSVPAGGVASDDEAESAPGDAGRWWRPPGALGDVAELVDVVEDDPVAVPLGRLPPLEDSVLVGGVWRRLSDPSEPEEPDSLPDVVPGDEGPEVELLLDVAGVPALLLDDDGELPVVGLACAIPDPLASAAPTPRVTAPAPSHRYASGRG
jgi:hypothetical protein